MLFFMIKLLPLLMYMLYFFTIFFLLLNLKNHPTVIMIILLIYSLLTCLNMSLWKSNYIFSIILFLMMISGLLIIFLYFSSLISNEQFNFKLSLLNLSFMILNSFLFFFYFNFSINSYKYNFSEINPILKINLSKFYSILNIFEYPLNNMTILSMFYLLISLFSIIKICSMKFFSMRKIN
uniref:NADH dehydrogenase subunit 6 n=1 Tax=Polyrhachis dives TaxID=84555 RepID=A0A0A0RUR9_9HYME|nr:NADH dehydrogenase subunit 6 [Polyrhachis dives]